MYNDIFNNAPQTEPERQEYFLTQVKTIAADLANEAGRPLTFHVTTFGCQMNARDSEKLCGIFKEVGYIETESEDADFVVFNTCTVRDHANQRVYGRLGVLHGYKKKNKAMKVALCGCMAQEEGVREKIKTSYSFVDLVFGTQNLYAFPELLFRTLSEGRRVVEAPDKTDILPESMPVSRAFSFKSGVNIMYGCDNFCSYCIVPYVRGRERSREAEDILQEIRKLAADGVKEVMLLGQNVNSYGKGLENGLSFAQLLRKVEEIDGIERIRFMTSHPKDLSDELIEVMAESKKICKHLHLPLQSGSSRILKAMNRRYDKEKYLALVEKIRTRIPDIAITTDIIIGFPGETDEDVEETIDVVNKAHFDNAFTFIYSIRTGTPAASMEQVPEEVAKRNFEKVLAVVQANARERAGLLTGQTVDVLAEEVNGQDSSLITGRLSNNTIVHFPASPDVVGTILQVKLLSCEGFYYLGEVVSG